MLKTLEDVSIEILRWVLEQVNKQLSPRRKKRYLNYCYIVDANHICSRRHSEIYIYFIFPEKIRLDMSYE